MAGAVYHTTYTMLCEFACMTFDCALPDAEDIVHDAYVQLLFEGGLLQEIEEEELLILVIADLRFLKQKQIKQEKYFEKRVEKNPENVYLEREITETLIQAISNLNSMQKRTLFHRFMEEETSANIAKFLNQSPGSVRKRLYDSLNILRECLKKAGYDNRDGW